MYKLYNVTYSLFAETYNANIYQQFNIYNQLIK